MFPYWGPCEDDRRDSGSEGTGSAKEQRAQDHHHNGGPVVYILPSSSSHTTTQLRTLSPSS